MKKGAKIISLLLSVIIVITICSPIASAYQADDPAYDFYYTEYDDGLYVNGIYEDVSGEVTIPESVFGKAVVGILSVMQGTSDDKGNMKFRTDGYSVTKINIPASVKSIVDYDNLFNVGFSGDDIYTVHPYYEVDTENESFSSESGILYNKDKSVLYSYPDAGDADFTMPDTVIRIYKYAFYGNSNIENVTVSEGTEKIGYNAFSECHNLNLTLPASLKEITDDENHICYLSNIRSVSISEDNPYYATENNVIYNKNKTRLIKYAEYRPDSAAGADIVILNTVEIIDDDAFNDNITSVCYPASVKDIAIPEGDMLKSITVSEDNEYYSSEDGVLYSKDKEKLIYYPPAKSGDTFKIPGTVKVIENHAFSDAYNIESIYIPKSVEHIGHAFLMTEFSRAKLSGVHYEGSINDWMNISFSLGGSSNPLTLGADFYTEGELVKDLYIDIEEIPYVAFAGCTSIESITLSDNVRSIEDYAFWNCINLKSVTMGSGLKKIDVSAFKHCTSLESFTVSSQLDSVGYAAFAFCSSLKSTNIYYMTSDIYTFVTYGCNNLDLNSRIFYWLRLIPFKEFKERLALGSNGISFIAGAYFSDDELNNDDSGGGGGAAALARVINAVVKALRKKK